MTKDAKPKVTEGQLRGYAAEQQFASAVAAHGWLYVPTASSTDFGIDGRVEIVSSDGSVSGHEFNVQVKGRRTCAEDEHADTISLHGIRTSTISYWFSKLSPTLIVLLRQDKGTFHYQWAHYAITAASFRETMIDEKETATLYIPHSNILSGDAWDQIAAEVQAVHAWYERLAVEGVAYNAFLLLYRSCSEVADLLFELLSRSAHATDAICQWLVQGDPALGAAFRATQGPIYRVTEPPPSGLLTACVQAVGGLMQLTQAGISSIGDAKIGPDSPLVMSLEGLAGVLENVWRRLTRSQDGTRDGYEALRDEKLAWVVADMRALPLLGVVALHLRDSLRQMREIGFPAARKGREHMKFTWISAVSEDHISPAGAWRVEAGKVPDRQSERSVKLGPLEFPVLMKGSRASDATRDAAEPAAAPDGASGRSADSPHKRGM